MPQSTDVPEKRTGIPVGVMGLVVVQALLLHRLVPDLGGYASIAETFLPWLVLVIVVLAALLLRRFSRFGAVGVGAAALVWGILFIPALLPQPESGTARLTIASENVRAGNAVAGALASDIAGRDPDIVALQELDADSLEAVTAVLETDYPHHVVVGTVGLWSTTPILDSRPLDLGLGWVRALWVDVDTEMGRTRIYAVHLDSIRPGQTSQRDEMLAELRATVEADVSPRVVVVGDFNSATTDRAFAQLSAVMTDVGTTSFGLGFTWPSAFPVARLDHLLVRGLIPASSRVLPDNGSDHRGILVGLR